MENKFSFKKILGNSMWSIIQNIISLVLSVLVTSIVARYLGAEKYGLVNYIISVVMLFTSFSTLGMETILIKEFVDNKENEGRVIGTSFFMRLAGGIILLIISQITLMILSPNDKTVQIIGAVMGSCMIFRSFEVIEYYLQSKMKLKISSIIRIITLVFASTSKILVVVFNWGIIGFTFSYLIDAIISGILFYCWYKLKVNEKWKIDFKYAKAILSKCWYIAISGLMVTIYMRIDQVMLGSMMDDKIQNGLYSAAVRIAEMWYFIPLAIITSFKPAIMNSKKVNENEYVRILQRLYDLTVIIGVVCGVVITIFAPLAIDILYGAEFSGAAKILSVSVWAGLFATLGSARSVWLVTEGLQKYSITYTLVGCILNIGLNIFLIPNYGAFGAAIATLVTQAFINIFVLALFKETRISTKMILESLFKNKLVKDTLENIFKRVTREEI
ncbi:MAG: flippase [Bacilli bacterium]|nr:flippase [Bacilli bacterium]